MSKLLIIIFPVCRDNFCSFLFSSCFTNRGTDWFCWRPFCECCLYSETRRKVQIFSLPQESTDCLSDQKGTEPFVVFSLYLLFNMSHLSFQCFLSGKPIVCVQCWPVIPYHLTMLLWEREIEKCRPGPLLGVSG